MDKEISVGFVLSMCLAVPLSIILSAFLWNMFGSWTTPVIRDYNDGKVICYVGQAKDEKGYYMYSNCPMYRIEKDLK